jgi:hypothetical protein
MTQLNALNTIISQFHEMSPARAAMNAVAAMMGEHEGRLAKLEDSLARTTAARDAIAGELRTVEAAINAAGGTQFQGNADFIAQLKRERDEARELVPELVKQCRVAYAVLSSLAAGCPDNEIAESRKRILANLEAVIVKAGETAPAFPLAPDADYFVSMAEEGDEDWHDAEVAADDRNQCAECDQVATGFDGEGTPFCDAHLPRKPAEADAAYDAAPADPISEAEIDRIVEVATGRAEAQRPVRPVGQVHECRSRYLTGDLPAVGDVVKCVEAHDSTLNKGDQFTVSRVDRGYLVFDGQYVYWPSRFELVERKWQTDAKRLEHLEQKSRPTTDAELLEAGL